MFAYALAKGIRLGYLPPSFTRSANAAWAGIQKEFIENKDGGINLLTTIGSAGLGGNPYRDGSFNYYVGEKTVTNDPKGVGAYLLAAVEMENLSDSSIGRGKTVLLDNYFNHELRKDENGREQTWHYVWDELDINGYSIFGNAFKNFGASLATLTKAPASEDLKNARVYIIVDPDTPKETTDPKFMDEKSASLIADWVKSGGVLAVFANDLGNCDLEHTNILVRKFGIEFNLDSVNHVDGSKFEMGKVLVPAANEIFKNARTIYMKEISTLKLSSPAKPLLNHNGSVIMATAKFGKGSVFVVGDPWLYNEYTDGRKLPAEYENLKAGRDLAHWLLVQAR